MRNSFFERIITLSPPETIAEGLIKGAAFGSVFAAFILETGLVEFNPQSAGKVLWIIGISTFIFVNWGFHNELKEQHDIHPHQP